MRIRLALLVAAAGMLAACTSTVGTTKQHTSTLTATTTITTTPMPTVTTKVTVTKKVPGPTRVVTKKVPQTYTQFGDGTYVIGTDIRPGVYKTAGPGSTSVMDSCYWAVLNTLDTNNIKDNGNINGPTTIQANGKALEVSGGCTWAKIG